MPHRICPWWLGYLLASPLRRLMQDPGKVVGPHVRAGMRVLEPGPGMGFFTLEMARRVREQGRVVAVDIQPKMLASLRRRAVRAGLDRQIETRLAQAASLGIDDLAGTVDFALAFAMVHELPDAAGFFREVSAALKPGGTMLLAEPAGHVTDADFEAELKLAAEAGLHVTAQPEIARSRAVVLKK